MDLLGTDSSTINAPDFDLVEDRQHRGAGPYQEGGRLQGKGSPRGSREDPPSRPPASTSPSACIYSVRGKPSGRRSLKVPVDPGLAPRPQGLSPDIGSQGSPQIDIFAFRQLAQTSRFFSWDAADAPEAINALSQRLDFELAFLFPPIPLLKRVIRKLERSRGTFLLVTPYWDTQTWFASLQALHVEDVRCLPFSDDLIDLTTGEPPPNLERLFLVVWKILGGIGESTPSQTGPSVSSRQDGSDPQKTATKERGNPSRPSSLFLHSFPSGVSEERLGLLDTPL
jgi:hypothetical protein